MDYVARELKLGAFEYTTKERSAIDTGRRTLQNRGFPSSSADVAELADALGSGPSSRKGVEVQVLSSAPKKALRHAKHAESSRCIERKGLAERLCAFAQNLHAAIL
jgi:hypothetical protein